MARRMCWLITAGASGPAEWAKRAVFAYHYWKGDAIIAERNLGIGRTKSSECSATRNALAGRLCWSLPNGAQIWMLGLDDKERVEKILGMEFVTIYFNECSQIRYATVQLVRNRLAQVVPGLKQRAYYDINPTGIGHWTNQEF